MADKSETDRLTVSRISTILLLHCGGTVQILCDLTYMERLRERTEHLDILLFPPITQWYSISDVLFTGGRGVSDFSVLKYY